MRGRLALLKRSLALVTALLVTACRESTAPAMPNLDVTVAGATAIERTDAGTRYWFDGTDAPTLTADAKLINLHWDTAPNRLVDGPTFTLAREPDGEHTLTLTTDRASRTLTIVFRKPARALSDAFAAKARADLPAAKRELDALPPDQWPWACVGLAREASLADKTDAYTACAEGAAKRGFISESISRRIAALFWACRLRQLSRARGLIEQLDRAFTEFPDARLASQFHYQHAVFLVETGELRDAERVVRLAIEESARAQRPDEASLYRAYAAVIVSESGHHTEALDEARALQGVAATSLSSNDQLALRSNLAWVKLRAFAQRAEGVDADALRDELTKLAADDLADEQALEASNTLSNLAWLELMLGQHERARAALAQARTHAGDAQTFEVLFLDWLDGRLALASGDGAAAVRAFESMLTRVSQSVDRLADSVWRAHLGLAEAHLLRNKPADAARELGEARRALSQQARDFADPSQRVAFLEDRRHAIADAVDAFARAGKCELAWRLADDGQAWLARSFESDRRVRLAQLGQTARANFERDEEAWALEREALLAETAPSLASVEELASWKKSRETKLEKLRTRATELAASLDTQAPLRSARTSFEPKSLAADEALVEWFHTTRGDRLFVVRASGVTCPAKDVPLKGLAHVTLVDGGAHVNTAFLRTVLATATVTFVPSAAWLNQPASVTRGLPLVVGDPRFDLPSARAEARGVAKKLGGDLLEGDAATLEAVLAKWTARPVLHFAGHGRLNASAPWEARLELAKGQTLDFELLLSRNPAPGLVVLSGCETGTALDAPADGIGLAEGFLAGGANHVLATTVEVRDDRARTFIERFYRLGGLTNPTTAYRLAVLEADAAGDDTWNEWKLFGRRRGTSE